MPEKGFISVHGYISRRETLMLSDIDKENLMVGYKQTIRAINDGQASKVFLAEECEDKIRLAVENAAAAHDTGVFYVRTMRELGSMCGIEVGASCAVVLK